MTDEKLRVRAIQELEFYKKDDTFMLADITVDLAIKALEQMPKILETLDFAIDASNGETNYFVGFRNGLRYSKSLIDEKEPQFENCTEQEQKTGHWIWCVGSHKCSNCEEYTCFSHKELLKYCPNCGAKMSEIPTGSESEG